MEDLTHKDGAIMGISWEYHGLFISNNMINRFA